MGGEGQSSFAAELGLESRVLEVAISADLGDVQGVLSSESVESLCPSDMLGFSLGNDKTEKVRFTFCHDCR